MTSFPWTLSGRNGNGGALRMTIQTFNSSGADFMNSRQLVSTCFACSNGKTSRPARISGPTGWSPNSNWVTTPKFPPPPRMAQNRSAFSFSLTCLFWPSAVTISAEMRLSIVSPCFRVSHPNPPPSVSPAIPVVELMPVGVARPTA